MAEQRYAAVDLGAESGRVVVGTFDGARLQLHETHRFPNIPVRTGDTLHWDILRLWNDIQDGLRKVGGDLSGIGVDTWGVDFGLLDAADSLIGNPVHYRDKRNDGMMDATFEMVPKSEVFNATGLQFLPFNTLYQLMALKTKASAQLEIAQTLLMMPDLLNFWLCGEKAAEYSIASTTQMLDARTRQWHQDLLVRLELPTSILPRVVASGTMLGTLRLDVAQRLGLSSQTPVIAPGGHDTASAIVAVPSQGDDWAYLSSGTWSLMGIELRAPLIDERVAELGFTNEGGVSDTIRFLKNIAGLWLVQECRRSWLRAGHEYSYEELTRLASESAPFGSVIEPDDPAFAAPDDMTRAIRDWCLQTNQAPPESVGAIVRCCLESLALKYRRTLESLEELRGARLNTLHIVGGGTQNKLLSRMTSDCLGRRVVCGPIEATAAGNILTQAMARGALKNLDEIRAVVRASFEVERWEPNADARAQWDEAYTRWMKLAQS